MKKFRVVLKEGNTAKPDQRVNGYLGNVFGDGKIATYERKEAKKKASMFGGEIEEVEGLHNVIGNLTMQTIPRSALIDGVEKQLRGREMFVDNDLHNSEQMFSGDVFEAIASEYDGVNKKTLNQLNELAELIHADYVLITNA